MCWALAIFKCMIEMTLEKFRSCGAARLDNGQDFDGKGFSKSGQNPRCSMLLPKNYQSSWTKVHLIPMQSN